MQLCFLPGVSVLSLLFLQIGAISSLWQWECVSKAQCVRIPEDSQSKNPLFPSIELCRLSCGKNGALWPLPTGQTVISASVVQFPLSSLHFDVDPKISGEAADFLHENVKLFRKIFSVPDTETCGLSGRVEVSISVESLNLTLDWKTDERYTLNIVTQDGLSSVKITANNVFGARHGLETLSQLIQPDNDCLVMNEEVDLQDGPVYPHRGLLLDTARNFLTIDNIKRHIDAMAASKLNVLHWHATDSQSFPVEIPQVPNMTKYGAYCTHRIYSETDLEELFLYAQIRGVRIIPEIDAPAHAGNGWQWGPESGLGDLSLCVNQAPYRSFCIEPPCGQLNPINSNVYIILEKIYQHVLDKIPSGEVFHMGGDEVFLPCWNSSREIVEYFGNRPRTEDAFLDLWSKYQEQALAALDKAVGNSRYNIIVWTSHLTQASNIAKYLDKERYVIQTWVPASDPLPNQLLKLGYRLITSTKDAWYLDHGFWGTTTYAKWDDVYNNKIPEDRNNLGGEVCMWGEYVDTFSVESRVWPRAAAAAERLWTNPATKATDAKERFYHHRERLVSRGINAEAIITRWCYQNEGQC